MGTMVSLCFSTSVGVVFCGLEFLISNCSIMEVGSPIVWDILPAFLSIKKECFYANAHLQIAVFDEIDDIR